MHWQQLSYQKIPTAKMQYRTTLIVVHVTKNKQLSAFPHDFTVGRAMENKPRKFNTVYEWFLAN